MKNILSLLILIAPVFTQAQTPDWTVIPQDFSNSMVIVGVLNINNTEASEEGDIVAAFVDGEVRGVASPVRDEGTGRNFIFMIVHGDSEGQELTFKVYDENQDQQIDLANVERFEINGIIGTVLQPFVWSDRVLNTDAEFLSFSIPKQVSQSSLGQDIKIDISERDDVSQIIPSFTISEGAKAFISNVEQESGVSIIDLTKPVTYAILSEDQQTINEIRITPNFVVVSSVEHFSDESLNIYPNPAVNSLTYTGINDFLGIVLINVYDVHGRLVISQSVEKKTIDIEVELDISGLESGIYLLKSFNGTTLAQSTQVIKN